MSVRLISSAGEETDSDNVIGFVVAQLGEMWAVYSKQGQKERLMRVYTTKEIATKAANVACLSLNNGQSVSFKGEIQDGIYIG